MPESEMSAIRRQIQAEYEAAQRGLSGLASGTARHDFISARTEHLGVLHERLTELVGADEAIAIIAQTIWTPHDRGISTV